MQRPREGLQQERDMRKFIPLVVMLIVSVCAIAYGCARADETAKAADAKTPETKPTTAPATEQASEPELAIRYAALAQETLRQKVVVPAHFKQSAALLMAAMKLDPKEPRYPRMLYEAMAQMQDFDGALAAIKAYREVSRNYPNVRPSTLQDQWAMVKYIDLSARKLETAEERLDFYKGFLETSAPDPVRAYVAFRAAQIARERGESDLEDTYLGQCLKLNPLNLDALRVRLDNLTQNGKPEERVDVLLSMLKSNPVQPGATYRLAREIADAGLPQDALRFYTLSVELANATGVPMGREFALNYASNLYLSGQNQLLTYSKAIVDNLIKQDLNDADSFLLRLLGERALGEKDNVAKTQQQLLNSSLNRLMVLRGKLGVTGAGATTRPVETAGALPLPGDLNEDLQKLNDDKFEDLRVPYTQAVADLAWYLAYAANQPAEAAKLLPTLKALLSDKDPTVVRIEGWIFLDEGKADQAAVKLKAVADQDVLAQASTYVLWAKNPKEKEPAAKAAGKLLQEHASGLLGAVLMDMFKELNVKLAEGPDAPAIKKALGAFDMNWLKILSAPQGFYSIRAGMEGGRVTYPFGEPMIARVEIRNISQYDLTIGPDGVIQNDLWFDAQLRGLFQQPITGAAYDRIGQRVVLKPGEFISQTVRFDQGQLSQLLFANPNADVMFYGQVRTNPRGDGSTGPCGYGVAFSPITNRTGFPLAANAVQNLANLVAAGKPDEKIRSLELVGAEIEALNAQLAQAANNPNPGAPGPDKNTQTFINALGEMLVKSIDDPNPSVATWGAFLTTLYNPAKRQPVIEHFIADPDPARRVVGLLLVSNYYPLEQQKQVLNGLMTAEKDDLVKLYASALSDIHKLVAAAAASTQPTNPGLLLPGDAPPPASTQIIPSAGTPAGEQQSGGVKQP
jgi:hypothetical protein